MTQPEDPRKLPDDPLAEMARFTRFSVVEYSKPRPILDLLNEAIEAEWPNGLPENE